MTIEAKADLERLLFDVARPHLPPGYKLALTVIPEFRVNNDRIKSVAIREVILTYFSLTAEDILKKDRRRNVVMARKITCSMLKHYTSSTLSEIAKFTGVEHHASVLHHIADLDDLMFNDDVNKQVIEIKSQIEASIAF